MPSNAENALVVFQTTVGTEERPTDWHQITQEQVIPAFKRFVNENRDQLRTELRDSLGITGGG